jgi:site-specific DNA-methyltransferase (adenine-specific)
MGGLDRSIGERGWIGAITVAEDGETFDGSARLETGAAKGWDFAADDIPVVKAEPGKPLIIDSDGSSPLIHRRRDLPSADDPRAKLLAIEANKIAADNLSWDADVLDLLRNDIDLSQLFTDDEMAALLADVPVEVGDGGDEFQAEPEEGPTRTALGDLWRILSPDGREHRLIVGDCTDPAVVERLMGGERAELGIHDPPYGIDASGMTMGSGESAKPRAARLSHNQEWDRRRPDIGHLFEASKMVCIWGGNYFADVLPVTNDWLCWWKKNDNLSFSEFELAWTNYGNNARHFAHHWGGEEKEHITQKPLPVIEWCISQCPGKVNIVVDFYLGSGTTIIAGHRTGRRVYGCEVSEKYADVILKRATAEGLTCERVEP